MLVHTATSIFRTSLPVRRDRAAESNRNSSARKRTINTGQSDRNFQQSLLLFYSSFSCAGVRSRTPRVFPKHRRSTVIPPSLRSSSSIDNAPHTHTPSSHKVFDSGNQTTHNAPVPRAHSISFPTGIIRSSGMAAANTTAIRFRSPSKRTRAAATMTMMTMLTFCGSIALRDGASAVEAFREPRRVGPGRQQRQQQRLLRHPSAKSSLALFPFFEDVAADAAVTAPWDHHVATTVVASLPDGPVTGGGGAESIGATLLAALSSSAGDDPEDAAAAELESEVLLDASHLLLDFSVFVTRSRSILRTAQIAGRVLLLVQDYIPDKHVAPEELIVQVFMIAVCLSKRSDNGGGGDEQRANMTTATTTTTRRRRSSAKPGDRFRD